MNLFDLFSFLGPFVLCFPFIAITPLVILMVFILWRISMKGKRQVMVVAISTEKRVMNKNTVDIWTCQMDGETVYFYNGGNLFARKFLPKVLQIQEMFEEGAQYRLTVAGMKRDGLGIFQNILSAEKLS